MIAQRSLIRLALGVVIGMGGACAVHAQAVSPELSESADNFQQMQAEEVWRSFRDQQVYDGNGSRIGRIVGIKAEKDGGFTVILLTRLRYGGGRRSVPASRIVRRDGRLVLTLP